MLLSRLLQENAWAIRQVGMRALEEVRLAGVPAYYMDPGLSEGIIREMPDGTRERIERQGGVNVVVERFGPRD